MKNLNPTGRRLEAGLDHATQLDNSDTTAANSAEKVHVVGAGGALTAAYEQLRNAAENTEEHLLLQNSIRRFYKQLFISRDEQLINSSGNELAVELTFAGYVANDSLTKETVDNISALAAAHFAAYEKLQKRRSIASETSSNWVLDTLSVEVEALINSHRRDAAFIDFAYSYLESAITPDAIDEKYREDPDYTAALFGAIHKALLKSNSAVIRTMLLRRYQVTVKDLSQYVSFNHRIDALLASPLSDTMYHIVDRQGAPLRIIRRMIEEHDDFTKLLKKREVFLDTFEQQVTREYSRLGRRINRAIVRSVIFLIITKFLVGIAIEVPYDLWAYGEIIWAPLIINLFFPPVYMVMLRLTNTLPGYANTTALVDRVDTMLYGESTTLMRKDISGRRYGPIFSAMYILLSLVVFGAVMWLLLMLNFSLVHIGVFFIFISAASFLGFRLSRLIRELEVTRSSSNGLTFIRDIIYLPFVVVGRWMSDKYAQVNIVTTVLDMLIELPLKTILRLVRQWGAFIDDRKDRIG